MRAAPRLIAVLLALLLAPALAPQAAAQHAPRAETRDWDYFVDFRARFSSRIGHTFIAYGRIDRRGRIVEERYAGLYPKDKYGHFLAIAAFAGPAYAVPAYIGTDKNDRDEPVVANYRRRLSAAGFARLQSTLRRMQTAQPRWHLFFYNCNDFAAQVAQAMGMVTPPSLAPPPLYVNALAALNGK